MPAGQILWVGYAQLLPMAALSTIILVLWFGLGSRSDRFGFYGLFALAVTAAVQLVGVYLVFASLVVPALASRGQAPGRCIGGARRLSRVPIPVRLCRSWQRGGVCLVLDRTVCKALRSSLLGRDKRIQ